MSHYLSRIRVARTPSVRALAPLLMPSERGQRRSAAHNLLWSVFADHPDRRRDFLWRKEDENTFLVLSERPPLQTDLFEPHDTRPFQPQLEPGERLAFRLRVNATRMKRGGRRVDVVMDELHAIPVDERAERRMDIASRAGSDWLARQGGKSGFRLCHARAEDYVTEVLAGHRGPRKGQPQFGILELAGHLEVTDPVTLISTIGQGFGRAKAFGCGLMLIRRAS
ncbi:type I-E CRISPR-associated protein Cas6/Cse3/CasE [Antarctobacter sp.]|uniref:type I-E CRISPR-associated protein Cas6/Cse3/CasE n=1 Tax=Antarctobacter sp. TaxID=1872577 RepID=UPI003A93AFE2